MEKVSSFTTRFCQIQLVACRVESNRKEDSLMRNLIYAALGGALLVVLMMISFAAGGGSNHYVQPQIVVQTPAMPPVLVPVQPQQIVIREVVSQPVQAEYEPAPEPVYSGTVEQPVFIQRPSHQTRNMVLATVGGVVAGVLIDRAAQRRPSYGYGGGYRQPGYQGGSYGRAISRPVNRPVPNRGRRR